MFTAVLLAPLLCSAAPPAGPLTPEQIFDYLRPHFRPPAKFADDKGDYRSPLLFDDGKPVKTADDWSKRRKEILNTGTASWGRGPS